MKNLLYLVAAICLSVIGGCADNGSQMKVEEYCCTFPEVYVKDFPQIDSLLDVVSKTIVFPENRMSDGIIELELELLGDSFNSIISADISWTDNAYLSRKRYYGYIEKNGKYFFVPSDITGFEIGFVQPMVSKDFSGKSFLVKSGNEYTLKSFKYLRLGYVYESGVFELDDSVFYNDMDAAIDSMLMNSTGFDDSEFFADSTKVN